MVRRAPVIAALLALSLLAPSAAGAKSIELAFGPIDVKGYKGSGVISGLDNQNYLYFDFWRKAGRHVQEHDYEIGEVDFSRKKSLKKGTASGDFGALGEMDMKFAATGKSKDKQFKIKAPPGCTGFRGKGRKGKLSGTFVFHADTGFFKTIELEKVKAALYDADKNDTEICATPGNPAGGPIPFLLTSSGPNYSLSARDPVGDHPEALAIRAYQDLGPDAAVTHAVFAVTDDESLFTHGPDATSATLNGRGPFLSGSAHYTTSNPQCPHYTDGTLKGNLTAKFDSYGNFTPLAGAGRPAHFEDPEARC